MVKKDEVHRAVIWRTKKEVGRKDGSRIRFDENAAVLLNSANDLEVLEFWTCSS